MSKRASYPIETKLREIERSASWLHRKLQEIAPISYVTILKWARSGELPVLWLPHVESVLGKKPEQKPELAPWLKKAVAAGERLEAKGELLYAPLQMKVGTWWLEYTKEGEATGRVAIGDGMHAFPLPEKRRQSPEALQGWAWTHAKARYVDLLKIPF